MVLLLPFPFFLLFAQLRDRRRCVGLGALQELQHRIAHPVLDRCCYRGRCRVLIATTTNGCSTSTTGGRWIH
uniref:Putative secreted peptide n=1 Tax=Anopheles braziliensis TaxID=58242 RepID=A0A2M3ZQJ1_9DIPT